MSAHKLSLTESGTRLKLLVHWLEPLVAGVLLALFFLPYPWSFLAPLPLGWVFLLTARARSGQAAFRTGFFAGLGFFGLHLIWLPMSFAGLFGMVIVPPLLLLPPLLGVFWGLTTAFCRSMGGGRRTLLALPFAWVVLEYLRAQGVFGFPWGTLGYAFLPTPMVQVADLGGVYLVSLLVAATAAALAALALAQRLPLLLVGMLLSAAALYGWTRPLPPAPDRTVLLVQGGVDPLEKAAERSASELDLYHDLTRAGLDAAPGADFAIWPEGASPLPPEDPRAREVLATFETPLLIGAPSYAPSYQNSAFALEDGAVTGRYAKVKLVPFGEAFPLREALSFLYDPLFAAIGLPGLVGVTPGKATAPLRLGDILVGAYICYESVFPQIARQMVAEGAEVLVNISNDAWFGRTAGAEQHFQMGRLRAIETRRYLARAGNDGITAVIDPFGRVALRFPRDERAVFAASLGLSGTTTPYVRWGDWVVALSAGVLAALVLEAALRLKAGRKGA